MSTPRRRELNKLAGKIWLDAASDSSAAAVSFDTVGKAANMSSPAVVRHYNTVHNLRLAAAKWVVANQPTTYSLGPNMTREQLAAVEAWVFIQRHSVDMKAGRYA